MVSDDNGRLRSSTNKAPSAAPANIPSLAGVSLSIWIKKRARIQADLRGLVACDVLCDDLTLQMYASDASIYQVRPLGVIRPRSTADVVACVQYAAENNLPVRAGRYRFSR